MKNVTRRDFGKAVAVAGATTALSSMRVLGANDRVRVGFIGLGNRGDQDLNAFLKHKDMQVVGLNDIYQPYIDFAAKKVEGDAKQFKDYRKLLEMKDLDAVVISTPDHWHALQMVDACRAGKDVYVEKPASLCVAEGRMMVEASQKYKRVTQVGIQRRSFPYCKEAVDFLRGGGIGKITRVRSFHIQNEWPNGIGNPPDSDPPAGLDWDAWLGPAPKVPYNKNRAFYRFRWFNDYSGGQLTNMATHSMDFIQWALGQDAPEAVTAMGGNYAVKDNREIPDTLEVLWRYPGGVMVSFSQYNASAAPADRRDSFIEFRGTKGTLYFGGSEAAVEVVPERITEEEFPINNPLDRTVGRSYRRDRKTLIEAKTFTGRGGTDLHARNFLDCIRSRKLCACDMETGHRSTTPTLLGNIAHKTKSYLEWDRKAERFTNNDAANRLLSYQYRKPYKLEV